MQALSFGAQEVRRALRDFDDGHALAEALPRDPRTRRQDCQQRGKTYALLRPRKRSSSGESGFRGSDEEQEADDDVETEMSDAV